MMWASECHTRWQHRVTQEKSIFQYHVLKPSDAGDTNRRLIMKQIFIVMAVVVAALITPTALTAATCVQKNTKSACDDAYGVRLAASPSVAGDFYSCTFTLRIFK